MSDTLPDTPFTAHSGSTAQAAAPAFAPLYQRLKAHAEKRMAQAAASGLQQHTHLAGIVSGGAWLADALQADLQLPAVGHVTSAMHRDDFAQRGLSSSGQTTLPFEVNGAHILLLDDVLHTGRTIRAVLNELFDYGRPASVELAVLADRQGRELPIQADFCAATICLPPHQALALRQHADGALYFITENRNGGQDSSTSTAGRTA